MLNMPHRTLLSLLLLLGMLAAPLAAQEDVGALEEQAIQAAVAKIAPSVVKIETFGGLEKVGELLVGTGPTTGLIVSEDGYILSSAFNFVQKPTSILVTLADGKRATATVTARDNSRMLVLLKINAEGKLPAPVAVPRKDLTVGQTSIAVGRTYDGDEPNLSIGIVSATNRIWGKAIQTDAKISPNNYGGPLVDLQGRVLGILVPLSPQAQGEIAGAEWYDSGIGFAVPLDEVRQHLDTMMKGTDLEAGIMGISLKGNDIYDGAVVIAACQGNSPAAKAGLKKDDTIVEVDGAVVTRQAQLRHAIGGKYAGDSIKVVAMRDGKRIETTLELVGELKPYAHPFLGLLPMRGTNPDQPGVVVRHVYPESPAAKQGIQAGDRLVKLADQEIADAATLQEMVATADAEKPYALELLRDGKPLKLELMATTLPTEIPGELPAAHAAPEASDDARPAVGEIEIKLPEEPNECAAYVPTDYNPNLSYGLVIWLHAPGKADTAELMKRWKDLCDQHDLILLAPRSLKPETWERTEVDYVAKAIDDVLGKYNIDRTRIIAHGYQGGATMAYLVALAHRDLIRGVAAVDAGLPRGAKAPANDPVHRLAIYTTKTEDEKVGKAVDAAVKQFTDQKYPVTVKDLGKEGRYLNAAEVAELVRWIDALDRI